MAARDDIELMQHADGELSDGQAADVDARLEREPDARAKADALGQISELVRSHLELAADDVPERSFDAIWRKVDRSISASDATPAPGTGAWGRVTGWLDRHRGHVITGAVSAGAVAALALLLRTTDDTRAPVRSNAIDVQPASMRVAPEIESLDTPDGEGTVLNLEDEDGHTTVIWVSPADTVEGI
jgi:anti-sigma factor RsiW